LAKILTLFSHHSSIEFILCRFISLANTLPFGGRGNIGTERSLGKFDKQPEKSRWDVDIVNGLKRLRNFPTRNKETAFSLLNAR
jgi:hypothetical protein